MTPGRPYRDFDLGQCRRGEVWRVELDRGANVFLVDSSNFSAFEAGRDFRHDGGGGLVTRSPDDLWFLARADGTSWPMPGA